MHSLKKLTQLGLTSAAGQQSETRTARGKHLRAALPLACFFRDCAAERAREVEQLGVRHGDSALQVMVVHQPLGVNGLRDCSRGSWNMHNTVGCLEFRRPCVELLRMLRIQATLVLVLAL